jgi:hypothetical protein
MNARNASWLNDTPAFLTVAMTRHTEGLVILANPVTRQNLTRTELRTRVDARSDPKRTFSPDVLDDLIECITSEKVVKRAAKLRRVLHQPLVLEGHTVKLAPRDAPIAEPVAAAFETPDLRYEVLAQTNFELPDPTTVDFVTAQPKVPVNFRVPGPPVFRSDVRNTVENSHLLAAIHSNVSSFDSSKNLIDRQAATTKKPLFTEADVIEGSRIFERFKECFMLDKPVVFDVESTAAWLRDSTEGALQSIVSSAPLGEFAATLRADAEFKTQSKAKAQPGFAATLPYGQSIVANSKVFNAHFAEVQPRIYLNIRRCMRPGAILDYGMSDEGLSAELRKLGLAHRMNGPTNFQADVSKQDSAHTPAFLVAFLMACKYCAVDQETLDFYLAYCQRYSFVSRSADGTSASVSWNLGSGDPFTLIRNDIMEMCVIACRYLHADKMTIVEKGDDVHGDLEDLTPHPCARLPSIASVTLKTDYGAVAYHAGRFHNGDRYLVDPVRAFLKHFTRLSSEATSNAELYKSFVSRATNYTESERDFLVVACQAMYPYYDASTIVSMIDLIIAMRDRSCFERYSVMRVKPFEIVVDTRSGCVENCLRAVRPRWSKSRIRSYRGLDAPELLYELQRDGVEVRFVNEFSENSKANEIQLSHSHARVRITPARHDL